MVFALLLYEEMISEDQYWKKLDTLFLAHPDSEDLLYLESETDRGSAIHYLRMHMDFNVFDCVHFGRVLMARIKEYYKNHSDLKSFSEKMYSLWRELPDNMRDKEPFFTLCYADDPLSYKDEKQSRNIYENMMGYYGD